MLFLLAMPLWYVLYFLTICISSLVRCRLTYFSHFNWVVCHPGHLAQQVGASSCAQNVAGSTPSQGTYLGCRFDPQPGHVQCVQSSFFKNWIFFLLLTRVLCIFWRPVLYCVFYKDSLPVCDLSFYSHSSAFHRTFFLF